MYKKEQGAENNVYCDRGANMPQGSEEVPGVKEQLSEPGLCPPPSILSTAREQEQKRTAASIAVLHPCSDKPLTNPLK